MSLLEAGDRAIGAERSPSDTSDIPLRVPRSLALIDMRCLAIGALAAAVAMTWTVLSFADRELIVTDESLYLVMIDNPALSSRSASAYHFLLRPLFSLVGESIIQWRLLRAFLDIGADVVLGVSLVSYLRSRRPAGHSICSGWAGVGITAAVTSVGFAAWVWPANGFGYNEVGNILSTLIAAALLIILKRPGVVTPGTFAASLALGALFVGLAITRWTGAVMIVLGCVVVLAVHHRGSALWRFFVSALTGAAMALVATQLWISDVGDLVDGIASGTRDVRRGSHSSSFLLDRYLLSFNTGVIFSIPNLLFVTATGWVFERWRAGKAQTVHVVAVVCVAVVWAFGGHRLVSDTRTWAMNSASFSLASISLTLLVSQGLERARRSDLWSSVTSTVLPLLLLAIPLAMAAGTNVLIFVQMLLLAPLWVVAAILLLGDGPIQPARVRSFGLAGVVVLGATCALLGIEGLYAAHYHAPLLESARVEEGRFAGLVLDEEKQIAFEELELLRRDLRPNPTVISLWMRPAPVFALGGHGIGFPWYSPNGIEAAVTTIEAACMEDGFVPADDVVFLVQETRSEYFSQIVSALETCGISFPGDFTQEATIVVPDTHHFDGPRPIEIALQVFVSRR